MPELNDQTSSAQGQGIGCLVRMFWMVAGNLLLLICAKAVLDRRGHGVGPADLVFWVLVAVLIGVRYLDVKKLNGETVSGKPATLVHWRRYALFLFLFAILLWGSAHAFALL
jgi:hypothetical protein